MPQLSSIVDPSTSLQNTQDLVRKIRFLASVRNKLIHDPTYVLFCLSYVAASAGFIYRSLNKSTIGPPLHHTPPINSYNRIDDRKRFINAYQTSKAELKAILRARGSRSSECVIM